MSLKNNSQARLDLRIKIKWCKFNKYSLSLVYSFYYKNLLFLSFLSDAKAKGKVESSCHFLNIAQLLPYWDWNISVAYFLAHSSPIEFHRQGQPYAITYQIFLHKLLVALACACEIGLVFYFKFISKIEKSLNITSNCTIWKMFK